MKLFRMKWIQFIYSPWSIYEYISFLFLQFHNMVNFDDFFWVKNFRLFSKKKKKKMWCALFVDEIFLCFSIYYCLTTFWIAPNEMRIDPGAIALSGNHFWAAITFLRQMVFCFHVIESQMKIFYCTIYCVIKSN